MYNFPIGVMIDSFKLPMKEAIAKTVAIGAKGFQMYATYGEHSPENMTAEKIAELKDMVYSNGLVFSALCGQIHIPLRSPLPKMHQYQRRSLLPHCWGSFSVP